MVEPGASVRPLGDRVFENVCLRFSRIVAEHFGLASLVIRYDLELVGCLVGPLQVVEAFSGESPQPEPKRDHAVRILVRVPRDARQERLVRGEHVRHVLRQMAAVPCFERAAVRCREFEESDAFLVCLREVHHVIFVLLRRFVGVLCLVSSRADDDVPDQVFAGLELECARD
jgi:hypothetical protein